MLTLPLETKKIGCVTNPPLTPPKGRGNYFLRTLNISNYTDGWMLTFIELIGKELSYTFAQRPLIIELL